MSKVIAEIRIDNIFTPFIHISKLPMEYKSSPVRIEQPEEDIDLLLEQGLVWYRDFIAFDMLTDNKNYWIKIAVKDRLEIDPVIITKTNNLTKSCGNTGVIILPFQVSTEELICVFGDDEITTKCSFSLPAGNYQLLFQNREFTVEEIEAEANFDCEDPEYDDWGELGLCLLSFIRTKEPIEPRFLTCSRRNSSTPLILYDRKLYPDSDD